MFQYTLPNEYKNVFGKVTEILLPFFTEQRIIKMRHILTMRSRHVLTVFENTHHGHNVSAVLRNVDSFGFMDLFLLYSKTDIRFRVNDTIDRGASQWLLPKRFTSTQECAKILKANGYKIALVSLPNFSRTAENFAKELPSFSSHEFSSKNFKNAMGDEKIALIFGSELMGVSFDWVEFADMYVNVEMFGFTESLNVSVCAGIILQSLRENLIKFGKITYLNDFEKKLIFEHWLAKTCSSSKEIIHNRHEELLPWFNFVRAGYFFRP